MTVRVSPSWAAASQVGGRAGRLSERQFGGGKRPTARGQRLDFGGHTLGRDRARRAVIGKGLWSRGLDGAAAARAARLVPECHWNQVLQPAMTCGGR